MDNFSFIKRYDNPVLQLNIFFFNFLEPISSMRTGGHRCIVLPKMLALRIMKYVIQHFLIFPFVSEILGRQQTLRTLCIFTTHIIKSNRCKYIVRFSLFMVRFIISSSALTYEQAEVTKFGTSDVKKIR